MDTYYTNIVYSLKKTKQTHKIHFTLTEKVDCFIQTLDSIICKQNS